MISEHDYYMGRDAAYPDELTAEIRINVAKLIPRVNAIIAMMARDGIAPAEDASTHCAVASGWRPGAVNAGIANAAARSKHMTGEAVDLRDNPERELCRWALANPDALVTMGLWMEDPRWTPGWLHLQCVPPKSGNLVFVPSSAPPMVAALKEQGGVA
jgi:hypothetical protein